MALLPLLVAGLLMGAGPVLAQNEGENQGQNGERDQQLPEIAPREIEIRGELQINFPSLERQPLTGFETTSSVPTFPADHLPSTEPYKQELDEIPQSLPEVQTVSSRLEASPDPASGLLEAGGGRYFHRFLRGRLTLPVSTYESFTVRGDYDGSNGYEPFEDSSVDTPYDNLGGGLRFESRRSRTVFSADVHGFYDAYTLYGARSSDARFVRDPDRTGQSLGGALSFRTRGSVPVSLGVSYDRTQYDTQVRPDSVAPARSFDEGRFGARGSVDFPVGPSDVHLDVQTSASNFSGDTNGTDDVDRDVLTADGGGHALLVKQGPIRVDGGARILAYSADATFDGTPIESSATFIAPYVDARWEAASGFTLYARNTPSLQTNDLASVYGENPFAEMSPILRPTLTTTDAEGGVEISAGPVRVTARAGFQYAPNYQYFGLTDSFGYSDGIFSVNYESAQIIHGGGSIALHGADRVQASLGVSVRDGQLVDGSRSIPNFAPLTVDGMVTFSFADDRGFLKLTGTVLSPRPLSPSGEEDIGTYADVDLEGSFEVSSLLHVVARIENVGATERWNRYPRPPAVLSAGLRIHW